MYMSSVLLGYYWLSEEILKLMAGYKMREATAASDLFNSNPSRGCYNCSYPLGGSPVVTVRVIELTE